MVSVSYKNRTYSFYGSETTDVEKLTHFIRATSSPMLSQNFPTLAAYQAAMEQQEKNIYFVFYGPDADKFEDWVYTFKNKLVATYFWAASNKIVCYKYGEEVQFAGLYNEADVSQFVTIN